jgi:hypothetical protein
MSLFCYMHIPVAAKRSTMSLFSYLDQNKRNQKSYVLYTVL